MFRWNLFRETVTFTVSTNQAWTWDSKKLTKLNLATIINVLSYHIHRKSFASNDFCPFDVLHHRAKSCKWVFPELIFSFNGGGGVLAVLVLNVWKMRSSKYTLELSGLTLFIVLGQCPGQDVMGAFWKGMVALYLQIRKCAVLKYTLKPHSNTELIGKKNSWPNFSGGNTGLFLLSKAQRAPNIRLLPDNFFYTWPDLHLKIIWYRVTQNIGYYPIFRVYPTFEVNLNIVCSLNTWCTRKYLRVIRYPKIPARIFQHFYMTQTCPLPNFFYTRPEPAR